MFRFLSKQGLKSIGVHHNRLQVHQPRRAISTTPRRKSENDCHYDDGSSHNTNSGDSAKSTSGYQSNPASFITWKDFSALGSDVAVLKVKIDNLMTGVNEVKTDIKDLNKRVGDKIDRILYVIISGLAGLLAKGYFDCENERKKIVEER